MENKRHVQSLVSKSKSIVRLKPRNPENKSSSPVMVQALCDFKQDQVGYLHILAQVYTHTRVHRIQCDLCVFVLCVSERYYDRK